jgi:hypothetical protein
VSMTLAAGPYRAVDREMNKLVMYASLWHPNEQ